MGNLLTPTLTFLLTLLVNIYTVSPTSVCPPYFTGSIPGDSCSREYSICVNGIHQIGTCEEDFVFYETQCVSVLKSPECEVEEGQEPVDEEVSNNLEEEEEVENSYEEVSTEKTTTVGNDVVAEQPETTTTTTTTESAGYEEPTDDDLFDCSNLADGKYAQGCSSFFYICLNKNSFVSHCPSNLVFNPASGSCEIECSTATTTEEAPSTTTEIAQEEPETTTTDEEPITTTTEEVTTTTQASTTTYSVLGTVCQESQIETFGKCASRFTKCVNNTVRTKQCPVNTLFDSSYLFCAYDLAECQPVTTVPLRPIVQQYPQPDIAVSPFDDADPIIAWKRPQIPVARPVAPIYENPFYIPSGPPRRPLKYRRRHPYNGRPLIDTPFSTSFRGRALLDDTYKDYRSNNQGRILYRESRPATLKRVRSRVADGFNGAKNEFIPNVDDVFPRTYTNRRLGPRENPNEYEDASGFEPNDVFGERSKRSAGYGPAQQQTPYVNNAAVTRKNQLASNCAGRTIPTFLSYGQCFDQFIYCSGTGINRFGACPVGESFDTRTESCSETCGQVITVTTVISEGTTAPTTTETTQETETSSQSSDDQVVVVGPTETTEETVTSYQSSEVVVGSTSTTQETVTSSPSSDYQVVVVRPTEVYSSPAEDASKCQGVSNGFFALGCSQEYIACSNGVAIRQVCPAALYFDQDQSLCNYIDLVPECKGTPVTTTSAPVDDIPLSPSYPTQSEGSSTSTYSPTIPPYNPTQPPSQPAPVAHDSVCHGRSDGAYAEGCSPSYIVCTKGKFIKALSCPVGEGFDTSIQLCNKFEKIPSHVCAHETTTDSSLIHPLPYVSLESVLTSTSGPAEDQTTTQGYGESTTIGYGPADDSTTQGYGAAEDQESTTQAYRAAEDQESTTLGYGASEDQESTTQGYGPADDSTTQGYEAPVGAIGDDQPPRRKDKHCDNVADNTKKALGSCRGLFIKCSKGKSIIEYCSEDEVYSKLHGQCVSRLAVSECRPATPKPVKGYYNAPVSKGDAFCDGKPDGLFRNPADCAGILQCFGGDVFEYPSCPGRLAFNEETGKCDYPQNVRGCDTPSHDEEQQGECHHHGAFISNPNECSSFYRCVWGRKVLMSCPSGTVFNPSLSVCDWPNAVGSCGSSAAASDEQEDVSNLY